MSKEAIIDKILTDAEARANAMVTEAELRADEIISAAAEQCKTYLYESKNTLENAVKDIEKRGKTVAELDAKKIMLGAKSKVLDEAFALALNKAKKLDKESYKTLILGMLKQAEDGDLVTISKRESGIITKKVVADEATKRGIKLTLNDELGDFDGGIILSNHGVYKNYTLEVEFSVLRDTMEAEVAKELLN
ncbi:MAG: V-type ATP synthase subunit E family protein [Clostridia bacterium]